MRDRSATESSIRWIDKLRQMAEEWAGWRSQTEQEHVFAQFEEERKISMTALQKKLSKPTPQ
ncbi:MAG: hypothetical protein ACJ0H0_07235 [Vicinamibacterales bacterium]